MLKENATNGFSLPSLYTAPTGLVCTDKCVVLKRYQQNAGVLSQNLTYSRTVAFYNSFSLMSLHDNYIITASHTKSLTVFISLQVMSLNSKAFVLMRPPFVT